MFFEGFQGSRGPRGKPGHSGSSGPKGYPGNNGKCVLNPEEKTYHSKCKLQLLLLQSILLSWSFICTLSYALVVVIHISLAWYQIL